MRNLPCLGVTSGGGGVGSIDGSTSDIAADKPTAVMDPTTLEAPSTPHASSYFATTYYHITDDECMLYMMLDFIKNIFNIFILFLSISQNSHNYILQVIHSGTWCFNNNL